MNYSDFKARVKALSFPIDEPENLVTIVDAFIEEALLEIQRYVPPYREANVDVISFADTLYNCGLTVVPARDGVIKRIYTVGPNFCCKVNYRKSTLARLRHLCSTTKLELGDGYGGLPNQPADKPALPLGDLYTDASSDSRLGRSGDGYWAVEGSRLYLWPNIQSTEDLVIEWAGLKYNYADDDPVFDARAVPAVRARLLRDLARQIDSNDAEAVKFDAIYQNELGNLYHWQQQKLEGSYAEEDTLPVITNTCATTGTTDTVVEVNAVQFAIIGNAGYATGDSLFVAKLVRDWTPQFVLSAGGNIAMPPSAANYDIAIGTGYHQFLSPYRGTSGVGSTDRNRFWPAPGREDRSGDTTLAAYRAFFPLPAYNNGLYYEHSEGPLQMFFVDSGFDMNGVNQQADGNSATSAQATWIKTRLRASKSPFKLVILQHPPYVSSSSMTGIVAYCDPILGGGCRVHYSEDSNPDNAASLLLMPGATVVLPATTAYVWATEINGAISGDPTEITAADVLVSVGGGLSISLVPSMTGGYSALRWPFAEWGATAVISSLPKLYERLTIGGLTYINAGLGGAGYDSFGTVNSGSAVRYNARPGAIRGAVSCNNLKLEFVTTDGVVQDTWEVKHNG